MPSSPSFASAWNAWRGLGEGGGVIVGRRKEARPPWPGFFDAEVAVVVGVIVSTVS